MTFQAIKTVRISRVAHSGTATATPPSAASGLAKPLVWLGAPSVGGLQLPSAQPTASNLYAPRGVWIDQQRLICCDSGNHRVLIWNSVPTSNQQPSDIVLGQTDFDSEGPAAGGQFVNNGFHLPTGVIVIDGKLLVADAWHHRILVWNRIPEKSTTPPDYAIGQADLNQVQPNRGSLPSNRSLYWPYGLAYIQGRLYVADTGNRRVLAWEGVPDPQQPAQWLLGQSDFTAAEENRGASPSAHSFRWPHDLAGNEDGLWIADAGNHRVLGWRQHPDQDRPADMVLGQPDMVNAQEWPYDTQGDRKLRFPYGIALQNQCLAVADTANNRVIFWKLPISTDYFAAASDVIGQADFDAFGENHWQAVTANSLCWPYGIALRQGLLAVADSGNNRVMLWDCNPIVGRQ